MQPVNVVRIITIVIAGLILIGETVPAKETTIMGKVLVKGARLHGANGIIFDSQDNLHIASVIGREIVIMDPKTGKIMDRLGADVGVETPDDLALGPEGTPHEGFLFWTSILTGDVGRQSPEGHTARQQVGLGANAITFSEDGRLFVALDFLGDALYEIDPALDLAPHLMASGLGFLNGMDFGPDGYLYGPIWTQGQVVRIDVDTTPPLFTTVADGLTNPAAVKFDSQGRLHVIDAYLGKIFLIEPETQTKKLIAHVERGLDNLAFDSKDRLYVSSFTDGSIIKVITGDDDCGSEDSCGKTRIISRGGMIAPGGVALKSGDRGESLFVGDFLSLREFSARTGKPKSVERHIITAPGITYPTTISSDGENLVLSTWFGNTVQIWNPQSREVVDQFDNFDIPMNAIRFQNDLIVAELGTHSVVRRIEDRDEHETLIAGLIVPAGLAATDDDLWVGDWATGIVWQIINDGSLLMPPVVIASGLSHPEGLAVDADGNLLVVESGAQRLAKINLTSGEKTVLVDGLALGAIGVPGYPPTWIFNGVTVGSTGHIYVTGDIANVVYRFKPQSR